MTTAPGLVGTLLAYTAARLGIVVAVAGLLVLAGVPLLLAALIGLIAAVPLSMLLLRGLRARLDVALAAVRERRAAEREVLRARLRGDDLAGSDLASSDLAGGSGSDDAAERKAEAGEHRPGQQE
jgi:Protein of unknown function (DUF4229)